MITITSRDGTQIGYERSGSGTPLLLVHGTTSDHLRWAPVIPALSQRFTVYAMDRRGRGLSGDAEEYALQREVQDILTVMESIGGKVDLVGHSFGAFCALTVARQSSAIRRLALYEPPPPGVAVLPDGLIDQTEALLAAGDRAGALSTFLEVAIGPEALAELRGSPLWPQRIAAAHTIVRELRALEAAPPLAPPDLAKVAIPTLLLLGGASPGLYRTTIEALHAALPHSQVVIMPEQQHLAMHTAPGLFAREVLAFLTAA